MFNKIFFGVLVILFMLGFGFPYLFSTRSDIAVDSGVLIVVGAIYYIGKSVYNGVRK